jgi:hypothetical protein
LAGALLVNINLFLRNRLKPLPPSFALMQKKQKITGRFVLLMPAFVKAHNRPKNREFFF